MFCTCISCKCHEKYILITFQFKNSTVNLSKQQVHVMVIYRHFGGFTLSSVIFHFPLISGQKFTLFTMPFKAILYLRLKEITNTTSRLFDR